MVVFIQRYTMPIVKIRLNKLQGATLSLTRVAQASDQLLAISMRVAREYKKQI